MRAQTPQEAATFAAELYAIKGLKEITAVARQAGAAENPQIDDGLAAIIAKTKAAMEAEVVATRGAVTAERAAETATVDNMRTVVTEAHTAGIPAVTSAAREFARNRANIDTFKAMQPTLKRASDADANGELLRQDAVKTVQVAAAVSTQMVELAREAEAVAKQLLDAQPEAHGQRFKEHTDAALSQVQLSRQLADIASKSIHKADQIATDALKKAKDAETRAKEALTNAQTNAGNLQKLKLRAERAVQRAKGQIN